MVRSGVLVEIPNIVLERDFYIIYSTKTNKPYLLEDMSIYCFELKTDGLNFVSKVKETEIKSDHIILKRNVLRDFYVSGVDVIRAKVKDKKEIRIPLKYEDFKDFNNNRKAERTITLLKQTGYKKYLRSLVNEKFYMPVIIDDRQICRYQDIHICKAAKNEEKSVLLFVSAKDFENWKKSQKFKWNAVMIPINNAADMSENRSINIYGYMKFDNAIIECMNSQKKEGIKNER